ncbi:hypothetical protein DFH07DRAFT_956481 [Mycena maculata]|uniref:Uncharacterized protein n=1 Tax=Mycena maculata TaxID=230809 RepID=A0AAD7JFL9_9AGAR|nr:hypothetical protein DFH07DRAFT_956481 [Mycena maculata]
MTNVEKTSQTERRRHPTLMLKTSLYELRDAAVEGTNPGNPHQNQNCHIHPNPARGHVHGFITLGLRSSPAATIENKGTHPTAPPIHPLSLASLIGNAYGPDNNEDSPIDHAFFRPNSPSPAPSASPAPHCPPSPSPSINHSPRSSPAPTRLMRSPSPSASAAPASPTATLTALPNNNYPMDLENTNEEARMAYLATVSTCAAENPHRPSPMHDPANLQAMPQYNRIQANDAAWPSPLIPDHVALQGVSTKHLTAIAAKPQEFLAAMLFCYGADLAEKHKNVHSEVLARLEEVVGKGKSREGRQVRPPIAWIIRCRNAEARKLLTDQATYGCTPTIGFHITIFNPKLLSWCAKFWATDIMDTPIVTGRRLCWAVREGIRTTSALFSSFDCMTQGGNMCSCDQCLINFGAAFEAWDLRGGGDDDDDKRDRWGAPRGYAARACEAASKKSEALHCPMLVHASLTYVFYATILSLGQSSAPTYVTCTVHTSSST